MKKVRTSVRLQVEELEAVTIICNIQAMQNHVHGKAFSYDDFNGNTLEELRNLQNDMIKEYNESF